MSGYFNQQQLPKLPRRVGAPGVLGGALTSDQWGMKAPRLPDFGGGGGGGGGTGLRAGIGAGGQRAQWELESFNKGGDGERVAFGLPTFRRVDGGGGGARPLGPQMSSHTTLPDLRGGRGGGGGGGGGFATYGDRPRLPIVSDRDGLTTAPMATGHRGPLSPDYSPAFGGTREFWEMQMRQRREKEQAQPVSGGAYKISDHGSPGTMTLPLMDRKADGGLLTPFLPTLVGERGPEVILPTQAGGMVLPNESLPAHLRAPGSDVTRGEIARNMLLLKPTPYAANSVLPGFSVFDGPAPRLPSFEPGPDSNVIPVSELPAGSRVPAVRDPLAGFAASPPAADVQGPVPLPTLGNPEGIIVGVTPRAPLTDSRPELPSREELRLARAERDVWRAARNNPGLAYRLLQDQQAAMDAQTAAQGRMALEQFQQDQMNARAQATIDAANARLNSTQQAARDKAAVDWQQKMWEVNNAEAMRQIGQQRARETYPLVNPNTGQVHPGAFMTGNGQQISVAQPAQLGTMETFPGSGVYMRTINDKPITALGTATMTQPALPDLQTPSLSMPGFGQVLPSMPIPGTAQPAQFKQQAKDDLKAKSAQKKERIDAYKNVIEALDAQLKSTTDAATITGITNKKTKVLTDWLNEVQADLNGDGVVTPDEAKAVLAAGPGATPAPVSRRQQWTGVRGSAQ